MIKAGDLERYHFRMTIGCDGATFELDADFTTDLLVIESYRGEKHRVAMIMGWGKAAQPDACGGAFWVYILAPVIGGIIAAILFTKLYEPLMNRQSSDCCCGKKKD